MKSLYSLSLTSQVPRGSPPFRIPFSTFQTVGSLGGFLTLSHARTDHPFGTPSSGNNVTHPSLSAATATTVPTKTVINNAAISFICVALIGMCRGCAKLKRLNHGVRDRAEACGLRIPTQPFGLRN